MNPYLSEQHLDLIMRWLNEGATITAVEPGSVKVEDGKLCGLRVKGAKQGLVFCFGGGREFDVMTLEYPIANCQIEAENGLNITFSEKVHGWESAAVMTP